MCEVDSNAYLGLNARLCTALGNVGCQYGKTDGRGDKTVK